MSSPPAPTARGLFITATDTGAGKTTLLRRLIPALENAGVALRIRKPVESGCSPKNGRLIPADATALANASSEALSPEQVCAYRLRHVSSPARAAQLENIELTIAKLAAACTVGADTPDGRFLLVESAGGFYSPIARDGLNADLACTLGLPLLVVVENRLGCINHALLTIEAAKHRHLKIAAVAVNRTAQEKDTDNYEELNALTDAPVFKMNYAKSDRSAARDIKALAEYLIKRDSRIQGG